MLGEGIEQLGVFAVFFALGVGLSALYIFGVGLTKPKLAAIIFDCIFGSGCLYVIWKVNLEVNNGECRAFLFVALALGSATSYFTCKRMLDKLSAMLYNLFTKVNDDGKDILQEVDSSNVRSGNTGSGVASLHATGNADAMVVAKRSRRRSGKGNRKGKARRGRNERALGTHATRRLDSPMGRRSRPH